MSRPTYRPNNQRMRQTVIKIVIALVVVIVGYYVAFVVFRRTATDSFEHFQDGKIEQQE